MYSLNWNQRKILDAFFQGALRISSNHLSRQVCIHWSRVILQAKDREQFWYHRHPEAKGDLLRGGQQFKYIFLRVRQWLLHSWIRVKYLIEPMFSLCLQDTLVKYHGEVHTFSNSKLILYSIYLDPFLKVLYFAFLRQNQLS